MRRHQARLSMAYKIINGQVILEPSLLPKNNFKQPTRQCNEVKVGRKNQLLEPQSRLDVTGHTFFYTTPKLWNNSVTPNQAKAPSIDAFRSHFKQDQMFNTHHM